MKNFSYTNLTCRDDASIHEILRLYSFEYSKVIPSYPFNENIITIESWNGAPYDEIRDISIGYPESTFTAAYIFEASDYVPTFKSEFKNGIATRPMMELNWLFFYEEDAQRYRAIMQSSYDLLLEKIESQITDMNIIMVNNNGRVIPNSAAGISFSVEDELFRMEISVVSAKGHPIIKCFQKNEVLI